ncbi:MAG TPA: glycine cleavage system aminomethyltransferase GcvT [Hyphomonadaceae bacterium]|nr:glycine cleavage system aminomethyltransferase GcvT [Hyphomonadaceae bacterium]HPN06095.1 glycine cleavage system aminomethyltransferase GcvT [Hyphomonadaceae bacterium]
MSEPSNMPLMKTPLHALHVKLGGRMVEFGGYDMPIQYPEGIMAEHNWTRAHAGLFDVSHMGPSFLALPELGGGDEAHRKVAAIVERLVPSDIAGLAPGKVQLTVLLNEDGGIIDDLMIGRPADPAMQGALYIVVNAGTKDNDFALIQKTAGAEATLRRADDRALIALQGPEAEAVVAGIIPEAVALTFMNFIQVEHKEFGRMVVTRCGYTGEDGFEILVPAEHGAAFAEKLLADARVKPIGLGARDSLRLEGGMCLYGHDIDTTKTPVAASLSWMISKPRRERGDFPGAQRILGELKNGVPSKRVGIKPTGRAPAREGTEIQSADGQVIGVVTSGGFGPSVNGPVAQGYVDTSYAKIGTPVKLIVRGKALEAEIAAMPFVPAKYKR